MRTGEFEWGDAKADANYFCHGITFEMATDVLDDPFAIIELDDRVDYGEDRFNAAGMVEDHLLFVAIPKRR